MKASHRFTAIAGIGLLVLVAGCGGPSGRIKGADEQALVGSRRAGAEVYRPTMTKALNEILNQYSGEVRAQGKMRVAFVGVENRSRDEIRDILEAINQTVETTITESRVFTLIAQQFVTAALREIGGQRDQIFLAAGRERFKSVLGKEGIVPDFLLFAKLTSMTTAAEGEREVYYQLTLQLVDANTGESVASKAAEIRKGYTN